MSNSASFTTPSISSLTSLEGVGTIHPVFNVLDEIGTLLDQPRIRGERNPEYKQRLATVFNQRANSTYLGLVYAITRGLGKQVTNAVAITPKISGGSFLAINPGLKVSGAFLYLYTDITNKAIDRKIDIYDANGSASLLVDLVARINESSYFSAALIGTTNPYDRSATLFNQTSRITIAKEVIHSTNKIQLLNTNIIKGSLFFNDRDIFAQEVNSIGAVISSGKYYIDYSHGLITTFDLATSNTTVRYDYFEVPIILRASPIIIHDTHVEDFRSKLFEQILSEDGNTIDGLPTSLGADYINELISVFPIYWGE